MSYISTWIFLVVGTALYWTLCKPDVPAMEYVAGLYFAAAALFMHWLASRLWAKT